MMFGLATRLFGNELTQGIEIEVETMILRGDLDAAGKKVLNRVVTAAMTELELGDIRSACLGDHLVTKTNAEYGNLAQKILHLVIGLFDGFGVAGAVRPGRLRRDSLQEPLRRRCSRAQS